MSIDSERLAIRRLALRGYLLQDCKVWYIADDDPERGLEKNWVGDWKDSAEDLYMALLEHDWPTENLEVFCPECKEAEVYLGDLCPRCSVKVVYETRGESLREMRVGK